MKVVLLVFLAGCSSSSTGAGQGNVAPASTDGSAPLPDAAAPSIGADMGVPDMPMSHHGGDPVPDGGISDAGKPNIPPTTDGGAFMPPMQTDPPVSHGGAQTVSVQQLLAGIDVNDVSVDQGGGVWAVSSSTVYYFAPGKTVPFTYDQKNGLARGQYSWTDTWFSPGTYPVTFSSVTAGVSGQAIVGEIGTIADRLEVNPSTGAVARIDNLQVTMNQIQGPEYPEHVKRVVATWRAVVDLNGTFSGTAYLGGFHGFSAFHGMMKDCGCTAFEEHQHYITSDMVYGDDVKGLALSAAGDVFTGDRDIVTYLPQRSKGASTDFFAYDFSWSVDVFPSVRDEIYALAADAQDGLYVASDGNGLAYLAPVTHVATYWSTMNSLPQNHLRGVAVDGKGDVWVGTQSAGVARLHPATASWTYYLQSTGLPSNDIHAVYWDKLTSGGKIYLATDNGIGIITP